MICDDYFHAVTGFRQTPRYMDVLQNANLGNLSNMTHFQLYKYHLSNYPNLTPQLKVTMGNLPSLVHTAEPRHPNSPRDVKTRRCLPFPGQLSSAWTQKATRKTVKWFRFPSPHGFSNWEVFKSSSDSAGWKHVKFIPNMAPLPSSAVGPSCLPGSKSS